MVSESCAPMCWRVDHSSGRIFQGSTITTVTSGRNRAFLQTPGLADRRRPQVDYRPVSSRRIVSETVAVIPTTNAIARATPHR